MADNENQWEEYKEEESQDYPEEYEDEAGQYSEQTYEEDGENSDYDNTEYDENSDEEYDDEDDDYENPSNNKSNGNGIIIIVVLILVLLLLAGAVFFITKRSSSGGQSVSNNVQETVAAPSEGGIEIQTNDAPNDDFFEQDGNANNDMISVDFNNQTGEANIPVENNEGTEIVATVSDQPAPEEKNNNDDIFSEGGLLSNVGKENDTIMVTYNPAARTNPFKPPVIEDKNKSEDLLNNTGFEIIEPPVKSVADENLTKLLQTQISGIMYDENSPSAIVNLNGVDQFVRVGDTVSGYTIESITKDCVQIKYKSNSYVASVGELFTRGSLEKRPAVANLENKFAGRYKNNN